MVIRVVGAGCKDCDKLYDNVVEAVKEVDYEVEIVKVEELLDIVQLGIMSSPALMIEDEVVAISRVPKKKEILKFMSNAKK